MAKATEDGTAWPIILRLMYGLGRDFCTTPMVVCPLRDSCMNKNP